MERFRGGFVSTTTGGGSGWEGLHRNSKRLVPKSFPKRPTSVYVSVLRWKTWLYSWRMSGSYSNQPTELPKDCIVSSGVFQATGLSWENINQGEWSRLANLLVQKLGLDPHHPDTTIRIHQLYMPIFFWLLKFCDQKKKAPIIGISCPQGGGKTTLTFALQYLFQQLRYQCAVASIDDFYITRKEQEELFHKEKNPLLEFRGNPGTHDIELGVQVLSQLQGCKSNNERVAIPRYNKAAWNGLGDRFPVEQWQWVDCPVDIILLEGWCLGFQPVKQEQLLDSRLQSINERLAAYQKWYDMLHGWLVIEIEDLNWIYDWRAQAEDMLRMQNKGAMTPEQVRDFVDRFMPAYRQYLFRFYQSLSLRNQPQNTLKFRIDKQRRPISFHTSKY